MPVIPDDGIVLVRSAASHGDKTVELLARAMRRSFRLWPEDCLPLHYPISLHDYFA